MKPFLVWLLVCAFGAAGCRATSKLATCGDGVEPITVASASPTGAPAPSSISAPPPDSAEGVRLAAYDLEELPPVNLVNPAETAAARIDVADWFAALPRRDRRMAKTLSQGCSTGDAATRYGVSPGRISQKRREFHRSWEKFQSDC